MDAIDLLIADHQRVRGLFAQFKSSSEADDVDALTTITAKIQDELDVHTTIEEEIFYPMVRSLNDELQELVAEGVEEHHEVKVLIDEAAALTSEDESWKAKWTVVVENVEHHAGEEESEMFPKVRSATTADDRGALGEQLDRRKGELGAPTLSDGIDLTADEARQLASDQEIPGRSKVSVDELRATVNPRG